jgi:hypothetical protein
VAEENVVDLVKKVLQQASPDLDRQEKKDLALKVVLASSKPLVLAALVSAALVSAALVSVVLADLEALAA